MDIGTENKQQDKCFSLEILIYHRPFKNLESS